VERIVGIIDALYRGVAPLGKGKYCPPGKATKFLNKNTTT